MLRNVFIGLIAGIVVGIFAGWGGAVLLVPHPTAHNLGVVDQLVTGVSIGFVCFSVGGLAGVFWPVKGSQRRPALITRLVVAFAISIPGDLVIGSFIWEAYQEGLRKHKKPDFKPPAFLEGATRLLRRTDGRGRILRCIWQPSPEMGRSRPAAKLAQTKECARIRGRGGLAFNSDGKLATSQTIIK